MAFSVLDIQMKALEWFSGHSVPQDVYPILRIDGRGFSKLTAKLNFKKPYDEDFHTAMGETARVVMANFGGVYAYHQSDEISILLPNTWDLFDRRVEKMISVASSLAAAVFNRTLDRERLIDRPFEDEERELDVFPHFDARMICALNLEQAAQYFHWRQLDATKNCLNSWAHWTAIQKGGKSANAAGKMFERQGVPFKNQYLFSQGINFNELPLWQRRGSGLYWAPWMKDSFNPVTKQPIQVQRWRIDADHALPAGEQYIEFVGKAAKARQESQP